MGFSDFEDFEDCDECSDFDGDKLRMDISSRVGGEVRPNVLISSL